MTSFTIQTKKDPRQATQPGFMVEQKWYQHKRQPGDAHTAAYRIDNQRISKHQRFIFLPLSRQAMFTRKQYFTWPIWTSACKRISEYGRRYRKTSNDPDKSYHYYYYLMSYVLLRPNVSRYLDFLWRGGGGGGGGGTGVGMLPVIKSTKCYMHTFVLVQIT